MFQFSHLIPFCLAFIAATRIATAAEPVVLDPLVRSGTAADWLLSDQIVPSVRGSLDPSAQSGGSGGVDRAFLRSQALSTSMYGGRPGALAQVRGLGLSSDETQVSAFGVPLNPPQGGGFDLSTFPQFLWSDFRWRAGPSIGTTDPRGSSGQLSLRPWTRAALARSDVESPYRARAVGLYSGLGLGQFAASGSMIRTSGAGAALVAGESRGLVQGPSASFSAQSAHFSLLGSNQARVRFDFLVTDLDAASEGSASFPTPLQHSRARRWIPLLQFDTPQLRTTFFADGSDLQASSPKYASVTHDQARQWGNDWAVALSEDGHARLGTSFRQVRYASIPFGVQTESIGHVSLIRDFDWAVSDAAAWTLEPQIRLVGVSRLGVYPEANIGVSRYLNGDSSFRFYGRLGVSRRFASLVDRYYQDPSFVPNPELKGEWMNHGRVGVEFHSPQSRGTFEILAQHRSNAQYVRSLSGSRTTVEAGATAQIWSAHLSGNWSLGALTRVDGSLIASWSRLSRTDLGSAEFPYVAPLAAVGGIEQELGWEHWSVRLDERVSSSASGGVGAPRVATYALTDFRLVQQASYGSASIAIENVFDRRPELVRTYPLPGRTLVLALEINTDF